MEQDMEEVKRQSQIKEELYVLQESLKRLEKTILILGGRLEPVMRKQGEITGGINKAKEPIKLAPLASELKGMNTRVQLLICWIENFYSRVEL